MVSSPSIWTIASPRSTARPSRSRESHGRKLSGALAARCSTPTAATTAARSARREDVLLLAEHFIEHYNRLWDRQVAVLSDEAIAALLRYPWPGNVRELENTIEYAFIMSSGPAILPRHLPPEVASFAASEESKEVESPPVARTLNDVERQAVLAALDRNGWRRQDTARELGIDKTTLWRKMKRFGITDPVPKKE